MKLLVTAATWCLCIVLPCIFWRWRLDLLGKHKIIAFLQNINIFVGSHFAKVCHILITFTGQILNIWKSHNCCLFKFINLFQVWLNPLLLNLRSTLELNCFLDKQYNLVSILWGNRVNQTVMFNMSRWRKSV